MVGAGPGTGRTDGGVVEEENVTGAVTDNADTGMFAALVGKQMAEDVLGTQAFQDGSGSVVFIADNGGSAFADDADFMKAFIVIAYGLASLKLFCSSVQAGEQFFILINGNVFK
mgnify:FL=1